MMRLQAVRGIALSLVLSPFLLTGSATSEAGSLPAQSIQERTYPRGADTFVEPPSGDDGRMRVVTRRAPEDWCQRLETTSLVVLQGHREVTRHDYCSAYNRGGASLVTDALGGHYVLLVYGEGHGTRATSDWLKVFRLADGFLMERANLIVREPIAVIADQVFDYRIETPPGGGLVLNGAWIVDDGGVDDDIDVPERSRTVIALDTAAGDVFQE